MDHKLRVLVRLDIDSTSAVLEVAGCLTEASCRALFPIIRRTHLLVRGLAITIELTRAGHIEAPALEVLRDFCAGQPASAAADDSTDANGVDVAISIIAPQDLPECSLPDSASRDVAMAAA